MGVHTAIETNGYFGDKLSDADLDNISLVLLGIKTWGPERHQHLTGMDSAPTLAFARRLADRKLPIWVRFVLVPGLTDDPENVAEIATFAAALGNVQRVEVLPFHQMGRYKWKELGLDYKLQDVEPPSAELTDRAVAQFRAVGLRAD
jgi:pyruvate formate lyase activating enzyme